MKQHKKHGESELIRRIVQREREQPQENEILICSHCLGEISQGRYYKIGGEAYCSRCIDACERRR